MQVSTEENGKDINYFTFIESGGAHIRHREDRSADSLGQHSCDF